jgi:radical SAM protein with 4Fe4S-binding SPASM domain
MFSTSLMGFEKGPAFIKSKSTKIDDYWTITNIPNDIPKKTATNNIKNFLNEIVALEIPTSLMCNANCTYCYIREKWLKNTHIKPEEISQVVQKSWDNILQFGDNENNKILTSWGAEPFCNLDTLDYLMTFCKHHGAMLNLSTNGTILNKRVKEMLYNMYKHYIVATETNLGVPSFQISLDGPKHIQDRFRPLYSRHSSYDKVMQFIDYMKELSIELNINERLYSLCSTVYLGDDSLEVYKDAIEFYLDDSNLDIYSPHLPIRIENSKDFNKEDAKLFYEMIKMSTELIIEKSKKTGKAYMDNYATKLFGSTCRITGWPRCSAMNTQLGIDIDGSIYMCHGPITTTKIKPFHVFGNVLDGIIDYRRFISVMDRMYADTAFKSICKTCDLGLNCPGALCRSCPPVADSVNMEPVNFNIHMCNIYKKCYPLWKKQYEQYQKSIDGGIPRWKE